MKRTLAFLLTVIMIVSAAAPAVFAVEIGDEGIQPRYTRLVTFDIDLSIDAKGKTTSYACATSSSGSDKINLTMELQQKVDGKRKTIKTWTNSGTFSV